MGKLTGKGLAEAAKKLLGTPYFYGSKVSYGKLTENFMEQMHKSYPNVVTSNYMKKARTKGQVGKINVDCSGVIANYTKRMLGSAQLYSTANKRLPISKIKDFAIGTVLWKEGHVGVYIGMENGVPMCIEAKGIDYGCVKSNVSSTNWKYGLTFSYISYEYTTKVSGISKVKNPYTKPTTNIKYGDSGDGVKWLQYELVEAGYSIKIDGKFGSNTKNALGKFQKSSKLTVDYICGINTRKALVADK